MKKKTKLSTIIKRSIWLLILVVLLITLGVFLIDKYSPTKNKFVNAYPDSYWDQEKLEGFTYADMLKELTNQYNVNSDEYVLPWVANGNPQPSDGVGIVNEARYLEELNKFNKQYGFEDKLNAAAQDKITYGAYTGTIADWLENFYKCSADPESTITITSAFTYVTQDESNKFSGTEEELFLLLKQNSGRPKLRSAFSKYDFDLDQTAYEELATVLSKDTKFQTSLTECSDPEKYNAAVAQYNEYSEVVTKMNELKSTLPDWKTYYASELVGYGGLVSGTDNKPALTKELSDGSRYEFWFDAYTTSFKVGYYDSSNTLLQEWYSNPQTEDTAANEDNKLAQKAILVLSYSVLKGKTDSYSTYTYSVSDYDAKTKESLKPQYAYKIDAENNKVIVWYKLNKRNIDYTYFPYYFSEERLQELLERNKVMYENGEKDSSGNPIPNLGATNADGEYTNNILRLALTTYYHKVNIQDNDNEFGREYYSYGNTSGTNQTSTNISNMSDIVKKELYKMFYEYCAYTEEDLASDNAEFNYTVNNEKPEYSIAIEYSLTEKGLEVSIPGNSIRELSDYPLTTIDILPYFSSTIKGVEGYTVIPDGSGAVMNHDNGNTVYAKYQKRVYTTDLTDSDYINTGKSNDLMFPMYSVVNTGNASGLCAYATSNAGQLELIADVSGRVDSYNVNYFKAYLRESQNVVIGSSYYKAELVKWTDKMNRNDITIDFDILNTDELSYSGVANHYRNTLIDLYGLTEKDTTTTPTLDMDVLGAYSYKDNFIGIQYTAKDSLTTVDQLKEMVADFKEEGIENINVFYEGWRNTCLKDASFKSFKVSSEIGSKKKFTELVNNASDGVTIYPYVSFSQINKYQESFGKNHYTAKGVDGNYSIKQPYDINSNIYDKKKAKIYTLSPRFYVNFAEQLADNYTKTLKGVSSIAIRGLGQTLSGDYKKGIETFKSDAINNQIESLDIITNSGLTDLTLYTPYDYAFKYVNVAKEIPYQATQYEILDYSIPFYQLVVNGLFDYSGESINANSQKGMNEHLMRMIETGSNLSFTFSYDSSEKLLQTDYNTYYYTQYNDWITDVKNLYGTLTNLGATSETSNDGVNIYGMRLVKHEFVANNVFKVTYEGNGSSVEVYLNYTRNSYKVSEDIIVPAKNYLVVR